MTCGCDYQVYKQIEHYLQISKHQVSTYKKNACPAQPELVLLVLARIYGSLEDSVLSAVFTPSNGVMVDLSIIVTGGSLSSLNLSTL